MEKKILYIKFNLPKWLEGATELLLKNHPFDGGYTNSYNIDHNFSF